MSAQAKLYTIAEYEAIAERPENAERRFELIDGEIVEMSPSELHGLIAALITAALVHHAKAHDLGRVTIEARHQMPGDEYNARLPDVAFTRKERALPIVEKGSIPQMPDLAVEVKSPDDTYLSLRRKAEYYLANGSQMVWLIYPEKRLIEIYRAEADVEILREEEVIDGGEVLPGLRLPVSDLFPA